jgi:hypothetical protein
VARSPEHVVKAPPFCTKGAVVDLKREKVEEKGGKEGEVYHPLFTRIKRFVQIGVHIKMHIKLSFR